jgi:transmembrane sensor
MDHLSDNTIPWHLISSALQGNLSREEDADLQQWITSSVQNRELFMQLKNAWHNDLDELRAYLQADEAIAWNAMRGKLEQGERSKESGQLMAIAGIRKKRARLIRIVSIAALFVLVTGFVIWYMKAGSTRNYKTGNAEQQSVALADGTVIKLFPASSMEVPEGYNELVRKVVLKNGEAFFEVRHKEENPFIVDLGIASVKDIGTSFRIKKSNDSIHVVVVTGIVEFRNNADNEVRLLKAGMQVTLLPGAGNSRPLMVIDSLTTASENQLRFVNISLPEVIRRFEAIYNKQIVISDSALMQKRFTGHLDGQSFESAMNVLCRSLNITFNRGNDIYYLKKE